KRMVLQRGDLPSDFGAVVGRYVSNSQVDATTAQHKNVDKLGRISGYYAAYSSIAVRGLTIVESFASLYERNRGALTSLQQSVAQETANGRELVVPAQKALAPLGRD